MVEGWKGDGGDGIDIATHLEPSVTGPIVYNVPVGLKRHCTTSRRGLHLLKFNVFNLTTISRTSVYVLRTYSNKSSLLHCKTLRILGTIHRIDL